MDYTVYQLLWLFLFYSFLGWLAETVLAALKRRRLLNRGFLSAPFSPTYGLGALLFAIFLPELREDPFFLFLLGMILATFLEFVTGVFLERIFHQKWWDYSGQRFQFEGHICLKYSVIWGLSALLAIFVLNPIFLTLVGLIPRTAGEIVLLVVYILLGVDFVGSWAAVLQLHGALSEPTHISRFLSRLTHTLDTTVTRHIQRRMERAYPSLERERLSGKQAPKVKPERFAQGCGFYKLAALFFIGSFLGDITETIWCWAVLGKLMSRSSVLYGPFSIVWGLGCVLLTALLYKYKDRSDRYIFLAGTVLGGAYSLQPWGTDQSAVLLFLGNCGRGMAEGPLSQTLSVDRADPHPLGKGGHLGAYRLYGVQHHHICPGTGPIHPAQRRGRPPDYSGALPGPPLPRPAD